MFQEKHLHWLVIRESWYNQEADMFQNKCLRKFWGKEETHSWGLMTFMEHSPGGGLLNFFLEILPKVIGLWTLSKLFAQSLRCKVVRCHGRTVSRE